MLNSKKKVTFTKLSDENARIQATPPLESVSGAIKELKLSSRIDTLLGNKGNQQKVSMDQRISAMIINGLGFSCRSLSMTPHFFSTKSTEDLIDPGVKPEYFNYRALGSALDYISEYGVTKFYATLALDIGIEHNLIGKTATRASKHLHLIDHVTNIIENIPSKSNVEIKKNIDSKNRAVENKIELLAGRR